tara:strand:+ start:420 stop:980 length:561 start_codon:yes stop_codon:yes gene_type:complete
MRDFLLLILFITPSFVFAGDDPTIQAMLQENNRIRIEEGLGPHIISPVLTKAAQDQSTYMSKTHDFDHITINNGSPGVRAARYGYSGTVRENLGRAQNSIPQVFYKWKNSPSHWESIIGDFLEVGFGHSIADDGTEYWVALYGIPRRNKWERVLNHQEETPRSPTLQKSPSRLSGKSSLNFLLISS